jgi:hypothetical protein
MIMNYKEKVWGLDWQFPPDRTLSPADAQFIAVDTVV